MPAGYTNLLIEQGATFFNTVELNNPDGTSMDLTDMTGLAKIRKSYYWDGNVYTLTVTVASPATDGILNISATAAQTALFSPGRYYYDLELINGDIVTRVIEGIAEVRPNASK
jgi:hypothetical protein